MQLRNATLPLALALGATVLGAAPGVAQEAFDARDGGSLLRYFVDSDHVAVRSYINDYSLPLNPDLGVTLHWNNERVEVPAIEAPVGSSEAVDAITTASRPIRGNAYSDFVKTRNELEGGLHRPHAALEYYHSIESDYLARQLGAKVDRDFLDRQLNVAVGGSYGWDSIDPLADDRTRTGPATKTTLHWDAVATRILSPGSIVRLGAEYNIVDGLQHNPYRHVYAGGTNVPERHPDHRQRRDAFVKFNQYLDNRSSVKLSYRLYNDDWGITSHELGSKLSQYVTHGVFARYEYRYYTQGSADFYRPEYATTAGIDGYLTGDYRMAALSSHLFAFTLDLDLGVLAPDTALLRRLGVYTDVERYFNSNNYSANIVETGLEFRF